MLKIGSHISFNAKNKYLYGAVEESIKNDANAMMIYLGPPQSTKRISYEKMFLQEYENEFLEIIPKKNIIVHAPYIINPSSVEKADFAVEFLNKEIETMNSLGLDTIVLHPGAHTQWTRAEGIQRLVKSLKAILDLTKTSNVKIALETMAGKGTEIGTSFEELKQIIDQVDSPRVGLCIDTCHIWDAGIEPSKNNLLKILNANNLKENVFVFHINDSKNIFNAHKDRHENLGKGHIPFEMLKELVNAKEFDDIPMILETPWIGDTPSHYKEEIIKLKRK